jgi:hypothetical protein
MQSDGLKGNSMPHTYRGFDINDATTSAPWGSRETTWNENMIDTLVGSSIQGVMDTSGVKFANLYDFNGATGISVVEGNCAGSTTTIIASDRVQLQSALTPNMYVATDESSNLVSVSGGTGSQGATGVAGSQGTTGVAGAVVSANYIPVTSSDGTAYIDSPLAVTGSGFVGIDTTAPASTLDVNGGMRVKIYVDTAKSGTENVSVATNGGITWVPSGGSDGTLAITLTNSSEGSIFYVCNTNGEYNQFTVAEWVFTDPCHSTISGILLYTSDAWRLISYTEM